MIIACSSNMRSTSSVIPALDLPRLLSPPYITHCPFSYLPFCYHPSCGRINLLHYFISGHSIFGSYSLLPFVLDCLSLFRVVYQKTMSSLRITFIIWQSFCQEVGFLPRHPLLSLAPIHPRSVSTLVLMIALILLWPLSKLNSGRFDLALLKWTACNSLVVAR